MGLGPWGWGYGVGAMGQGPWGRAGVQRGKGRKNRERVKENDDILKSVQRV